MEYGRVLGVYKAILSGGGAIINGNGRNIQIWDATIICKGIIESVINRPIAVLSSCNFIVLDLL